MEVIYALMDKGFECVYAGNSIWYVYVEDKIVAEINLDQ